jgi:hypothetical protein
MDRKIFEKFMIFLMIFEKFWIFFKKKKTLGGRVGQDQPSHLGWAKTGPVQWQS